MTVRVFPRPSPVFGFSQVTVNPVVDMTEGVKIRMLVNCPSALLVNSAVNPIACTAEGRPTGSAEENETPGAGKTPGCVVDHLSVSPDVTTHVHILGSLSVGHSP